MFFFVAFGLYKFTPQEAAGIQPLMAHSLLLFWVDPVLGVRGGPAVFGVIEIAIGLAIAARQFAPALSAWGSLGAVFALLDTKSFLFTTPGLDPQSSDAQLPAHVTRALRHRPVFPNRTAEGDRAND